MKKLDNSQKKYRDILIGIIFLVLLIGGSYWFGGERDLTEDKSKLNNQHTEPKTYTEIDMFRNQSVQFVRDVAESYLEGGALEYPEELAIEGNWDIKVSIYHDRGIKGEGTGLANNAVLSSVLKEVTESAVSSLNTDLYPSLDKETKEALPELRFLVTFAYLSDNPFSFIEYEGEGKKFIEDLVIVRNLDKDLLLEKINQGKDFLFFAENTDVHGFYKKYDALSDSFEDRVHTVYTSSIVYTFLKIYEFDKDERVLAGLSQWGDFLLSMQNKEEKEYGAFHYSYYFEKEEKELKFVVGTTALTIFTLLDLREKTGEEKYLESARLGGNWLITMQKEDGSMRSYKRFTGDGKWYLSTQESLLYNGQVLSALSRLYSATNDKKYYDAAEKIAERFAVKVDVGGCYLGDDYRSPNPISSAWVIMSLLDFYKVDKSDSYRDIIFKCSNDLLLRQLVDEKDIFHYGRWNRAYSSSGNGWLAEVMVEMYKFCESQGMGDCDKFKDAATRVTLWIIQNTYTSENTFLVLNPENSIGGIFWDYKDKYVRTDSLCHALNAYAFLVDNLPDDFLLSVPEDSLWDILDNLKK